MKTVFVLALLAAVSYGGYAVYQKLGPNAGPYLAYQRYATATVRGSHMAGRAVAARFGAAGNIPDILSIEYQLESQRKEGDGRVRIVAIQYVTRVYRDDFGNPSGRPKVSKSRQHALIEKVADGWKVKDLESQKLD